MTEDVAIPSRDDRHETPLLVQLRDQIRRGPPGGLSVQDYMDTCVRTYYGAGRVFGTAGDFVTAPEISQIFGELIGLWCAIVWQQMGRPPAFNLIELGPGRGTMMRDALRALRLVPDCLGAARVHLIEQSQALRGAQADTLAGCGVGLSWPTEISAIDSLPSIVLGNEFVDALPVHQLVWSNGAWHTRCVTQGSAGQLMFTAGQRFGSDPQEAPAPPFVARLSVTAREGDIVEFRQPGDLILGLDRFMKSDIAVLLIDYGHMHSSVGDTLQAVRAHRYEDPLCSPGEADLTAHVDFEELARSLTRRGLTVDPVVTQAAFLASLGISERASRLMTANPAEVNAIEMAVGRLLSPSGMGARFKVLGARGPHLPPLPGLPA
jgi:NADH dehydrogenase [ubiquinone] 1 alpha subcomplex assembly factor 7